MKINLLRAICIAAVMLILFGCDRNTRADSKQPLEELPGDYSLSDAMADGCLVIEDGDVANLEVLDQFVQDVNHGDYAFLRKYHCSNLTIDPDFDPEYYNSVKDDYPKITIFDIVYDSGQYSVRYYDEDGNLTVREFPYFGQHHFDPPNQYAAITGGTAYFLCERDDVLFQDILNSLLSCQTADLPDFYIICMVNEYKDNFA